MKSQKGAGTSYLSSPRNGEGNTEVANLYTAGADVWLEQRLRQSQYYFFQLTIKAKFSLALKWLQDRLEEPMSSQTIEQTGQNLQQCFWGKGFEGWDTWDEENWAIPTSLGNLWVASPHVLRPRGGGGSFGFAGRCRTSP